MVSKGPDPIVAVGPALDGLTRSHCVGCPPGWTIEPCEFHEVLRRPQSGAAGARCAVLTPRGGTRGLAEDTQSQVDARVAEGVIAAQQKAAHAVLLYAFGTDLCRLATPALWESGTDAQKKALDALEAHKGDDRWPRELLDLIDNGLSPIRALDMAVLEQAGRAGGTSQIDWESVGRDVKRARQQSGQVRADAVRASIGALKTTWDLEAQWRASEAVRQRAIGVALDGALRAQRRCPATLEELAPTRLTRTPEGWTLDAASCRAVVPTTPDGAAPQTETPTGLATGGRDH